MPPDGRGPRLAALFLTQAGWYLDPRTGQYELHDERGQHVVSISRETVNQVPDAAELLSARFGTELRVQRL
jgi:hypothetical protein